MKNQKLKKTLTLFFIFFIFGVYLLFSKSDFATSVKEIFPKFIKDGLKNTVFYIPSKMRQLQDTVYKVQKMDLKIRNLNKKIDVLNSKLNSGKTFEETLTDANSNEFLLRKIFLDYSLDERKNKTEKKNGYLEIFNDNVLVIFWSGKIIYTNKNNLKKENVEFFELKTDINKFLKDDKEKFISIKDAIISNNKIYLSYTKNIKPETNCLNLSVIEANIFESSEKLELSSFKEFFTYDDCLEARFNGYQSGGRLENYKNEKILLTIGDFQNFSPAQDPNSFFGKIILIDKNTKNFKLVSMGHRNPQGLLYDENLDIILSTEHGQKGGDEINLILNDNGEIGNYGWPIASYSNYYGYESNNIKKIAPFKKSHKENGFIEPLIYFTPALGISQIVKDSLFKYEDQNLYLVSSLAKQKIVFLKLKKNLESASSENELFIGERIRDIIKFETNNYLLFLEESPAIGILSRK